jgi:hypothetical protein
MPKSTSLTGLAAGLVLTIALPFATFSGASADDAYGDAEGDAPTDNTAQSLEDAFFGGTPWLNVRYRYESVDQDGFAEDAEAHTVRTRLGYETGAFMGFTLGAEVENIVPIGGENFNDTLNGKTQFPTVADPETTEINQAYIRYLDLPQTTLTLGRQRVVLDNHRWVGDVGFRQNQQTFDTLTAVNQSIDDVTVVYGYVWGVRRIFGEDSAAGTFNTNVHLVNATYAGFDLSKVTGYAYILDVDDSAAASTNNYGLRLTGSNAITDGGLKFTHAAEYARQSDNADNPADVGLNYYLIEPGLAYEGLSAKLGYEVLEGDGTTALQTPLATLHAHQGWADQFLTTPADGIEEMRAKLVYTVPGDSFAGGIKLWAVYHDFDSENTSADLGEELDLKIAKTLFKHLTLSLKWASYSADSHSVDTDKLFAEAVLKF